MNILIDTHIFLWLANDNIDLIRENQLEYLKDINGDILKTLKNMNIDILDFDAKSALILSSLPFHHRDPFDRMIISQAIRKKYKIMSADKKFKLYNCELL